MNDVFFIGLIGSTSEGFTLLPDLAASYRRVLSCVTRACAPARG